MTARPSPLPEHDVGFYSHHNIPAAREYEDWGHTMISWAVEYNGENPAVEDIVGALVVHLHKQDATYTQICELPDDRAGWHRNYTPLLPWLRAHILRLIKDWRSKRLAEFFETHPQLTTEYGFHAGDDGLNRYTAEPPNQSRLWEMWHKEFPEPLQNSCRKIASGLVEELRNRGIPAPDPVFRPDEKDVESEQSKRKLRREKTQEIWQQAKPFVTDTFELDRGDNAQIHENAFWENQAYCGMREEMYAQDGSDNFASDTTRDRVPSGSNHRYQVQKLNVASVRSMLQETTQTLVARARHNNELTGKLWAAIDITKGNEWHGRVERDEHGDLDEDYILGYKNNNLYFQWATIQIVGLDTPLVLDAIPVKRGMPKHEIVDELIEGALDIVDDIELVMMDREFDSEGVKDICQDYGVHYLNPARKQASERTMCTKLRQAGRKVHVVEQTSLQGPTRKRMYLPAQNTEVFEPEDPELAKDDEAEKNIRQGLVEEFVEIGGEADGLEDSPIEDLIEDIRDEEGPKRGNQADVDAYALFETNHPALTAEKDTEDALLAEVQGFIDRYDHRWGIENGYKKIKQFRVRTTSKKHNYRYFNFAFACVLYNVWRLVDLLVKLAFEDEPDYTPMVTADQFLTEAKKFYGLDPPD